MIYFLCLFYLMCSYPLAMANPHTAALESLRREHLSILKRRESVLKTRIEDAESKKGVAFASFLLGLHYYGAGNLERAASLFEKAGKEKHAANSFRNLSRLFFALSSPKKIRPSESLEIAKAAFHDPGLAGFRQEVYSVLLSSLESLDKLNEYRNFFAQYLNRYPYGKRDPELLFRAASYFDKKKAKSQHFRALEELMSLYPLHDRAFEALGLFFAKSCDDSKSLSALTLLRLSRHATYESGLRDFVDRFATSLPHFEKDGELGNAGYFLLRSRAPKKAVEFALNHLEHIGHPIYSNMEYYQRGIMLLLLAQAHQRSGDHEQAARVASIFLTEYQASPQIYQATELLADALAALRIHQSAAKLYEVVAQSNKSLPLVKWHRFWNLYLGQNFDQAFKLLGYAAYVPPRDAEIPLGLEYWKARLNEKLGRTSDAEKNFQHIMKSDSHGYYQFLTLSRKNKWFRSESDNSLILGEDEFSAPDDIVRESTTSEPKLNQEIWSAAISEESLQFLRLMAEFGFTDMAKKYSKGIPWDKIQKAGYAEAGLLIAQTIGEHRIIERLSKNAFHNVPINNIPDNLKHVLFPTPFFAQVDYATKAFSIDPYLFYSIMRAESYFDTDALSSVGARGLMQIIPTTAMRIARALKDDSFNVHELHHPGINIFYAAYYLRLLMDHYNDNIVPVIAAYNAGPEVVDQWIRNYSNLEIDEFIESIPYKETRKYVKTVVRNYHHYAVAHGQKSGAVGKIGSIPQRVSNIATF